MNAHIKRTGRYVTVITFMFIFAVYLVTLLLLFPNMPVVAHLAENIPGYDTNYPPFRVDEYNYHTIAENILNGNLYEKDSLERSYTTGFPLFAVLFIAAFGKIGGYIANVFIMWVCLILFYLIVKRYCSRVKAIVLTIILAFATLNWFYAASCYTEPLSQLLVLLSFYLLTTKHDLKRWGAAVILAGSAAAFNLFVRPHYILLTVPFFLFLWESKEKILTFNNRAFLFAGGAVVVVVLWMLRNIFVFDGLLLLSIHASWTVTSPAPRAAT